MPATAVQIVHLVLSALTHTQPSLVAQETVTQANTLHLIIPARTARPTVQNVSLPQHVQDAVQALYSTMANA